MRTSKTPEIHLESNSRLYQITGQVVDRLAMTCKRRHQRLAGQVRFGRVAGWHKNCLVQPGG